VTTRPAPAVSPLGQVARVRGDVGDLLRRLTAHYDPPTPTDPRETPGDRTNMHKHTKADLTPTPTPLLPPLEQHLTHREVTQHYGLSNGPLTKMIGEGKVKRYGRVATGTGGALDQLDHRDIIEAFDRGFLGLPRAGGRHELTIEQRDAWRANIADAIRRLNIERNGTANVTTVPASDVKAIQRIASDVQRIYTSEPVVAAVREDRAPERSRTLGAALEKQHNAREVWSRLDVLAGRIEGMAMMDDRLTVFATDLESAIRDLARIYR
jgi:hypothetical protein